ncbi:hypothetical protein P4T20_04525 [Aneurinibacillus thermoaerophilus]|uniref:hypothetical protein n=1 Tax=Aneurinibacillus thermoaerophilus TaxID=143495 RepID=UPI002E226DEE|nr:hypothetical protein [Aneurinibacillus thermoaerophilus]
MVILKTKCPTNLAFLQTVCVLEKEEKIQDADAKQNLAGDVYASFIAFTRPIKYDVQ